MKFYDRYFSNKRMLVAEAMSLAFRYQIPTSAYTEEELARITPSVLYIPERDRESPRNDMGYTSHAVFVAINAVERRNPGKTSVRSVGLSRLRFTDYRAFIDEEPIRKLIEEESAKLWEYRENRLEAELKDDMSDEEVDRLVEKYPPYRPRLISEYDSFFSSVTQADVRYGQNRYDRALDFSQFLEVVCRHVDGDSPFLLPEGRNVFIVRLTKRLRNPLLYTGLHFTEFVVTFEPESQTWLLESGSIAGVEQTRFKDKTTRLFWQA